MTTPGSTRQAVTQLLGEWSNGDERALGKLFPLVHPELHRLARHYMLSALISQYFIRVQVDHELSPVAPKMGGHVMGVYVKIDRAEFSKIFTGARAQTESADNPMRFASHGSRKPTAI